MRRPKGLQAENARKLMEKSPCCCQLLESDQSLPRQFGCNICGEENQRYSRRKKVLVLAKLECCHLSNKETSQKPLKRNKLQNPKRNNACLKKKVPLYKIRERKLLKKRQKINTSMETLLGEISKFSITIVLQADKKYKRPLKNFQDKCSWRIKGKKSGTRFKKTDLRKSLKRKKIYKNPKRMVSSKSTGLKSPRYESPTKTIKYK